MFSLMLLWAAKNITPDCLPGIALTMIGDGVLIVSVVYIIWG